MDNTCIYVNKNTNFYYEIWQNNSCRSLKFKEQGIQTTIDLEQPHVLQFSYLKSMSVGMQFSPSVKKILILGLGGGALSHYIKHYYPAVNLTVVEKESEVVNCAKKYFSLNTKEIDIKIADGFDFIKNSKQKFDMIFVDLFSLDKTLPYSMVVFYRCCRELLSSKGTLVCNNTFTSPEVIQEIFKINYLFFNGNVLSLPIDNHLNLVTIGTNNQNFQKKIKKLCHNDKLKIIHNSSHYGLIGSINN